MKATRTWARGALLTMGILVGCGGGQSKARDAGRDVRISDANETQDAPRADAATNDASDGDAGCVPACAANHTCVLGVCQPTPVQMAAMPGCGAAHLVVGGATLYWTESATGVVKSLPTATPGGTPTVVASGQSFPDVLAVDDTNVYWTNDGDTSAASPDGGAGSFALVKAPRAGGAPTPLPTAPAIVSGIVANAGTIYYGAGASTYSLAPGSATPTTLMTFATCKTSRTGALALDVDHLYQTDYLSQFLSRELIDGTQSVTDPCPTDAAAPPLIAAPTTISHSQGELFEGALAIVDGQLIWADSSNLYGEPGNGSATGALTLASTANAGVVTGFVVSGTSIYIGESGANQGTGDAVEIAPLDPGDAGTAVATIIATTSGTVSELAADAAHIYWVVTASATDGGAADCTIVSLTK